MGGWLEGGWGGRVLGLPEPGFPWGLYPLPFAIHTFVGSAKSLLGRQRVGWMGEQSVGSAN